MSAVPVKFACPHCGRDYSLTLDPAKLTTKPRATCGRCQKGFDIATQIAAAQNATATPVPAPAPEPLVAPAPKTSPSPAPVTPPPPVATKAETPPDQSAAGSVDFSRLTDLAREFAEAAARFTPVGKSPDLSAVRRLPPTAPSATTTPPSAPVPAPAPAPNIVPAQARRPSGLRIPLKSVAAASVAPPAAPAVTPPVAAPTPPQPAPEAPPVRRHSSAMNHAAVIKPRASAAVDEFDRKSSQQITALRTSPVPSVPKLAAFTPAPPIDDGDWLPTASSVAVTPPMPTEAPAISAPPETPQPEPATPVEKTWLDLADPGLASLPELSTNEMQALFSRLRG